MRKIIFILVIAMTGTLFGWTLGKYGEMTFKKYGDNLYVMHGPVEDPSVDNQGFMNNPALITHQNSKSVFLGDNVMVGRLGAFDESSSVLGNIELLQGLMKNDTNVRYVPGQGATGDKNSTVGVYLHYLEVLADEAKKAYANEQESYEAKKPAMARFKAYEGWNAFARQMGRHLEKVYMEIEENDM